MLQRSTTWVGVSAKEIARAVRRGDTSATEVVADHLDSIRSYDRILNAFREVRAGAAIGHRSARQRKAISSVSAPPTRQ